MTPPMTDEQIKNAVDYVIQERKLRKPNQVVMEGADDFRVNKIDNYALDKEFADMDKEVWDE